MLKVCFIITKLELGGAQKVALYTAQNLDKKDFESFLICGGGGILDAAAEKSLRVFKLKSLVREISPVKDLIALIMLFRILKKENPDIVHTHSSKAGILGRIAAKMAGIETVIHTIHGYGFNETQKFPVKYLYIYIEKFCAFLTDKLIAVSKEDIKKGLHYGIAKENKFVLIRAGIDEIFFKEPLIDGQFKKNLLKDEKLKAVVTVGPFKPQKNLSDFIRAAAIVCKENSGVVFLMVGDGEQRGKIEKLSLDLGVKDKILFLGWQSAIFNILHSCDIFVLTSLWEGLPCSAVEAMRCLKPVIANAVDGVKEIIKDGENGFLIEPYNYQKTAEKIKTLLKDDALRLKMGRAAADSINEEFNIAYNVKQQEALYKRLSFI